MKRPAPIAVLLLAGPDDGTRTALFKALSADAENGCLGITHDEARKAADQPATCLCCSGPNEAMTLLEALVRDVDNARHPPFSVLVVDLGATTEPAEFLGALAGHPYLSLRYAPPRLVACLDAGPPPDTAAALVLLADVIVAPADAAPADARNPAAHRLTSEAARTSPPALLTLPDVAASHRSAAARALRLRKALSGGR